MKILSNVSFGGWTFIATKPPKSFHRIAILLPASHGLAKSVQKGFIDHLQEISKASFSFEIFDGEARDEIIARHASDIVHDSFDLIFSIGVSCTKKMKQAIEWSKIDTPLICAGIPQETSEAQRQYNMTGVASTCHYPYYDKMSVIFSIKKNAKNILIVWGNDTKHKVVSQIAKKLSGIIENYARSVACANAFDFNKIKQLISASKNPIDTIITLRDYSTLYDIECLADLCSAHGVTLVSSDAYSISKGASIAFASEEGVTGQEAAKKAGMILENMQKPHLIPFTVPKYTFKILINSKTMKQQGLEIDPDLLSAIGQVELT